MSPSTTTLIVLIGILIVACAGMAAYKFLKPDVPTDPPAMTHPEEHMFELAAPPKGNFTWIMHSSAATIKAGAELMAHELSKYLQRAGWRVRILLYDCPGDNFDGIELVRMPYKAPLDERCRAVLAETDVLACQNMDPEEGMKIAEEFGLPICFFLHLDIEKVEVLQQRWNVPVFVVYNAMTQHEIVPTIHEWTVVRPHVDYRKFEGLDTSEARTVTLLNCIANKGGHVLKALAEMMPDVQFAGVRGGYGDQVTDGEGPNIEYLAHTDNPLPYYANSRVIIMPSKSESWGRVALEAMAAGIPVIVGDTPGLRECTSNAAPVCAQSDLGCWEREIRRLYHNGPDRTEAIRKGKARVAELKAANDYAAFDRYIQEKVVPLKKTLPA